MEIFAVMIATALNFILLKYKFEHEKYIDLVLDVITLIILSKLFGGTLGGMVIAMGAGAMISVYLLMFPPAFLKDL